MLCISIFSIFSQHRAKKLQNCESMCHFLWLKSNSMKAAHNDKTVCCLDTC